MSHLIAPSLLASDFSNLRSEIEMINKSNADWFHLDVMDGVFVPNISFGLPVIKSISQYAKKTLDVHLMIIQPERYIHDFSKVGADILTVHFEACNHLHRTIQTIKQHDMKAGVAINPHTSVDVLSDIINDLDIICLMSVNPGFGGQSFIENTYQKIETLKKLKQKSGHNFLIEIDGGVTLENAGKLIQCGADVLVAGSTVFQAKEPTKIIEKLKNI